MSWSWECLGKMLARSSKAEIQMWCRREGIDYSLPARLLYLMLMDQPETDEGRARSDDAGSGEARSNGVTLLGSSDPQDCALPRMMDPEASWRELLEWRLPSTSLNLLQLAVVCNDIPCMEYLWQPAFTREENYRDSSSRLVNHPWHLLLATDADTLNPLSLSEMFCRILCQDGTVDLTSTRLQTQQQQQHQQHHGTSQQMAASPVASPAPAPAQEPASEAAITLGNQTSAAPNPNPLAQLLARNAAEIPSLLVFCRPETGTGIGLAMKFSQRYFWELAHLVFREVCGPDVRACVIECLWEVIKTWSTSLATEQMFISMLNLVIKSLRGLHDARAEELLILGCQLLCAVDENFYSSNPRLVVELFMSTKGRNVSIEKAAGYLPRPCYTILLDPRWLGCCFSDGELQEMRRGRLRGGEDMVSLLQAVRGDARRIWSLSLLEDAKKELFHVPFQELYCQLKA